MTGAIAYWRRRALDFKLGTVLLVGGIIGTLLGVAFFNSMRGWASSSSSSCCPTSRCWAASAG